PHRASPALDTRSHPPLPFVREAEALPLEAKGTLPWVELFRMERWHEAARALDGEHPNVLSRPEVRYARAAAAERLGDSRRVVELLKNLESQLPLLADTIREKRARADRKSTRLNSSHVKISYAVFCLKKKNRYSRLA